MTTGECAAMLAIAGQVYGRDVAIATVEVWASFMGDVSAAEGVAALRAHVVESPHFPTVADVRKRVAAARMGTRGDVGAAWGEVRRAIARVGSYGSPRWSSPAIEHAVESLGWREICHTRDDDVPTLRAQFERYFRAGLVRIEHSANAGALEAHVSLRALPGGKDAP